MAQAGGDVSGQRLHTAGHLLLQQGAQTCGRSGILLWQGAARVARQCNSIKQYNISLGSSALQVLAKGWEHFAAGSSKSKHVMHILNLCPILTPICQHPLAPNALQVLAKDGDHFEARFARARLYPLINEPWKAKQQYSALLERHPGHPEVRRRPAG